MNIIFWLILLPIGILFWGIVIIFLVLFAFGIFGIKKDIQEDKDE